MPTSCNLLFLLGLSKPAQDGLLWSLQAQQEPHDKVETSSEDDESSNEKSSESDRCQRQKVKTSWYLGTQQICRRAWARMLGIGQSRLQRTRHSWQGLDERTLPGWTITPVDQPVLQMLFAFFQMVYDCMTNNLTSQSLISAGAQPRSALMTASVNAFMYKTYYSISETMPTRLGNDLVLISDELLVSEFNIMESLFNLNWISGNW